jgi:hypothetical protein
MPLSQYIVIGSSVRSFMQNLSCQCRIVSQYGNVVRLQKSREIVYVKIYP